MLIWVLFFLVTVIASSTTSASQILTKQDNVASERVVDEILVDGRAVLQRVNSASEVKGFYAKIELPTLKGGNKYRAKITIANPYSEAIDFSTATVGHLIVPVEVHGQPSVWQCSIDEEFTCWGLFQELPPTDPNYLESCGLFEWKPDPQNFPLGFFCNTSECSGPVGARKCSLGGGFRPLSPPNAAENFWYKAIPAEIGIQGWLGVEEQESPFACGEITKCKCVGLAQFCQVGEIIDWIPVETTYDLTSERCDGTAWGSN